MRTTQEFLASIRGVKQMTDLFDKHQTPTRNGMIDNEPAPAILEVIKKAESNSQGDLDIRDSIYLAKVNLSLRALIKNSTGQLVSDDFIRNFYSSLLSVTSTDTKALFLRFIYDQIKRLDPNVVIDDDFVCNSEDIFNDMIAGPSTFKLKSLSSNQEILSRIFEFAPEECKENINLKNVQSLYLWYKSNKSNTLQISKELPEVLELLFHFRPDNTWEIFKSLKGNGGNFVDAFTQENVFDNYIDLIESWGLNIEKMHVHYKAALRQLLEFHRFDDEHIVEKSLHGEEASLEDREAVSKDSLEYAFDKLKNLYPNAIGVLIPDEIRFEDSHIKSYSTPSIFRSDLCTIVTTFQEIIQGKKYWDSKRKQFVDNEYTAFQAPINVEGWDMMVLARFILMIMYEDNRLLGEYKYERLKLLRDSFIEKHSKYLVLEENENIAQLTGEVNVPKIQKLVPFKMIVPDVKTKPSVLRKIFAKGLHISSMRDKLRCKFVLPETLTIAETKESIRHILAYIFSIHGDTTMEEPRCTLKDLTEGELGNLHNAFSNPAAQSFKVTVRHISDKLKSSIKKKHTDRSNLITEETMSLQNSENRISEIKGEIAKLTALAGASSVLDGILSQLEQERITIRDRIAKLNLIENFDVNLDLHDEDSVCVEIQITRGPGPDDHDRYEYDMICAILKRNLPYHERAVRESLDFLLFNNLKSAQESSQEKRYMWLVQLLFEYLLDIRNQQINIFQDDQNQLKLNAILRRILNQETQMLSQLYYDDRESDLRNFIQDLEI